MSVAFALLLFGTMLIYGGWTNRSIWSLARGDNTVAKPVIGSSGQSGSGTIRAAG
jgi:hypothetical protein